MSQEGSRTTGLDGRGRSHGGPPPLTVRQLGTLLAAVGRELTFGLPLAIRELHRWRNVAERIPDPTLRADALDALRTKRGFAVGAGLFTILPRHRSTALLRVLVALETIIDYLDNVSERHPDVANGRQLHQALVDAVDLAHPPRADDYYRLHTAGDDGGYLHRLVATCRTSCAQLPSYAVVMPLMVREARRKEVLALNHDPEPDRRDAALAAWAAAEYPDLDDLAWWEITGAASSSLLMLALLALAVERDVDEHAVEAVTAATWPWTDLATTLLDSLIDWQADTASGAHSYMAHYNDPARAIERVRTSVAHSSRLALQAPRGRRHAVIVAAMTALFLSAPAASALAPVRAIATDAGALARLLVPILGLWRLLAHQRS